ncbi:N-acylneuraminate cytidylyltransferase A isoform X3 [Palaemon carinicauda]|uniref:N-acylneuraminate cytidylyltransferase A isoform X3 n=1 Tax=Palaemon carinicauda TaxID=392227 RepID=UPI0035B5F710
MVANILRTIIWIQYKERFLLKKGLHWKTVAWVYTGPSFTNQGFNSLWVSTDDDNIAEHAEKGQANVHRRASYTATDEATSLTAIQEFLQYHPEVSIVCLVQCTSPFVKVKYLREGVKKILSDYDSVFSVTRRHNLRWTEGNDTKPQNFDPSNRPRRQDWGGDLCENGMFYFTRVSLIHQGLLQGGRCGYVEIPTEDSLEIDTPLDIIIAQEWLHYNKRQSVSILGYEN